MSRSAVDLGRYLYDTHNVRKVSDADTCRWSTAPSKMVHCVNIPRAAVFRISLTWRRSATSSVRVRYLRVVAQPDTLAILAHGCGGTQTVLNTTHRLRGPEPVVAAEEPGSAGGVYGAQQTKSGCTRHVFNSGRWLQLDSYGLLSRANGDEQSMSNINGRKIIRPEGG